MSQGPSDIPPLPVMPIPVEPVYPSFPAMPLHMGRPGVITFIGVTSIVIAALCIVAGLGAGLMDFGLFAASSRPMAVRVPMTVSTPTGGVTTGGTSERLPFSGLAAADRQIFADGLQRVRPLSTDQLLQLDELLAEEGRTVTGGGPMLAPEQIAASVTTSGPVPNGDSSGSDYFVLGTGRLEIFPDRAVLFPVNGQPSVRSNAIVIPPTAGPTELQPDQIRSILRTVNELNGSRIKSAQMKKLVSALEQRGQQIITPTADGSDPAYEITSVATGLDGTLTVSCTQGGNVSSFSCDSNGIAVSQSTYSVSSATAMRSPPKIDRTAGLAAVFLTIAQILLAVFLLIIGILTLRSNPRGRLLHWIYVVLKVPLAIATASANAWMWTSMIQSSIPPGPSAAGAAAGAATAGAMFGVIPGAIGLVWPVVLLFVLLSRSVRMYYATAAPNR